MMLALMPAIPMTPHPPSSKHVCRKVSSPGRLLVAARVSIKRPNRRGPTKAVPASATLGGNQRQHAAALGRQQVYDPGIQPHEVHGGQRYRS